MSSILEHVATFACNCGNIVFSSTSCTGFAGTSFIDQAFIVGLLVFGFISYLLLFFVNAPYGKFHDAWQDRGGFSLNGKFAFALQEAGSPIAFALTIWYYCFHTNQVDFYNLISHNYYAPLLYMIMFETHYIHRAFIYPLKAVSMGDSKILVVSMALSFTCVNGYLNAKYILFQSSVQTVSPVYIGLGVVLFAFGMSQNIACDNHLIELRKKAAAQGTRQYFIPTKSLFQYVSAGNYLGEMIEWCGFALASQNCASVQFAIFTYMNLFPRALATHKYYQEKFKGEYPANRKAIIPFVL